MAKFKLTNLKFEKMMQDYAKIRETTIPDAVHANARLLCVELARRTQAFGHDSEEKQNERIRKDISNIIKPPVYFLKFLQKTTSEKLKAALKKSYFANRWTDLSDTLAKVGMGSESFTLVSGDALRGIHKVNRNKSTGRVYKRPSKFYLASDSSALSNYIAERQKLAGLAKSGWAECANQLRKVVSGALTRGIKPWVTRHSRGLGSVSDNTANLFRPTVRLTNKLPWADKVIRPSEQLMAQSVVAEKMKRQMAMILKKRITKLQEAA